MSTRRLHVTPREGAFESGLADIQQLLALRTGFSAEVEAAAAYAAAHPRLPELDRTDLEFITIDPPGSMDLDQAMCLLRTASGFRVHYAIADVAAFVSPGDPVDVEAHLRGQTLYGADSSLTLHPRVLCAGAASLLPGQVRPALLWTIDLDALGNIKTVDVRRAQVRSRQRLDYASVQARIDAGLAEPMWDVLRDIGLARKQLEQARGGVSLGLPEQEMRKVDGTWQLAYRINLPVEEWNAQISLLTGVAAAQLMVAGKVGLLRTLPPPEPQAIARLRLTARALDIAWPADLSYAGFIRALDPAQPRHVAMMTSSTTVLRGAGYAAFNGELPAQPMHSALAACYAHVTAPLRRLVDRYAGEICVALCAGQPIPEWVLSALPRLPATMQLSDRRAHKYEAAIIDLVEALMLQPRVGESFAGSIIEISGTGAPSRGLAAESLQHGIVMLRDLAIEARVNSVPASALGTQVAVSLREADPQRRSTVFEMVK